MSILRDTSVAAIRGLSDLPAPVQLLGVIPLFYAIARASADVADWLVGPPSYANDRAKVWGAMGALAGVAFWALLIGPLHRL